MIPTPEDLARNMPRLAEAMEAVEARKGKQYATDLMIVLTLVNNIEAAMAVLMHAATAHGCMDAPVVQDLYQSMIGRSKTLGERLGVEWPEVVSLSKLVVSDLFSNRH